MRVFVSHLLNENDVNIFETIETRHFNTSNYIRSVVGEFHLLNLINELGRIQDLRKGGSDKRPSKAIAPGGGPGACSPGKFLILGSLKCDFQRFQGQFEVA